MSVYNIEFLESAEIELLETFEYYNTQQAGLGQRFVKELSHYLDSIADNPYKYALKYNNPFRFTPLKVFPYLIAYWIDIEDNRIYVASIFHTSRNPRKFEDLRL
ncbi:type II toxin-antitoxin system RelE/ParE family toxin [Dyadobacter aurulentus]|uniref:type II toxin-antitoxin system RelE/ParE family toxin n=1 Tax=Dyadobacter sp. UC 10 TaxID=2605428 RepID=UPI0011F23317|nr:type II toxin-antitoxin system RelE/ParE family toxin [Dyadobacter sp. UC 10]KAA0989781.1 type II toxin-antitoxin system RelE/ParE family toxin [Dyadobacter sp. UC 10]